MILTCKLANISYNKLNQQRESNIMSNLEFTSSEYHQEIRDIADSLFSIPSGYLSKIKPVEKLLNDINL